MDMVMHFVMNHQDYFIGVASGFALAHIPEATLYAFHLAMKIPWLRRAVVSNPERAKGIVRTIEQAVEQGIDQEVLADKTTTAALTAPAPGPQPPAAPGAA